MPQFLLELLPELIEHIYRYLSISDIISIACCSKDYYKSVLFLLWATAKVPWNVDIDKLSWRRKKKVRFVRNLIFGEENEYLHQPSTTDEWELASSNFKCIVEYCDSRKLTSLRFNIACSDADLELTADVLRNLYQLTLHKCEDVTEKGWQSISTMGSLRELNLSDCGIQDADVSQIINKLSLRKLILNQCRQLSSECLSSISSLASLQELSLSCWQFKNGEPGLNQLSTMKSIKVLNLTGFYNASNDSIALVKSLKSLTELDLSCSSNLDDKGLGTVSSLSSLKILNICDCNKVTDTGIEKLAVMPNLQVLNISGCWKLSDFGLIHLKPLVTLRELSIGGCRFITDVGISHLVSLNLLRRLNVSGCFYVTDIGLAELSNISTLNELSVGACCITDLGIRQLQLLTVLENLSISQCHRVTDFGLSEISKMMSLKRLNINGCINITFIGLVQLVDLRLDELNIKNCGLSDESVEQFCLYSGMKELFGNDGCMNSRVLTRNLRLWNKQLKQWACNEVQGWYQPC